MIDVDFNDCTWVLNEFGKLRSRPGPGNQSSIYECTKIRGIEGSSFVVKKIKRTANGLGRDFNYSIYRAYLQRIEDKLTSESNIELKSLNLPTNYIESHLAIPKACIWKNEATGKKFFGYAMTDLTGKCSFNLKLDGSEGTKALFSLSHLVIPSADERNSFGVPIIRQELRFQLMFDFFRTLALIHQRDLIVGDISWANLVIQPYRRKNRKLARLIFLDVDSFAVKGEPPPIAQPNTDPFLAPEIQMAQILSSSGGQPLSWEAWKETQNKKTDVYKSGIVAISVLSKTWAECGPMDSKKKLEIALEDFRLHSSRELFEVLACAVDRNPENRPTSLELFSTMSEFLATD